MSHKDYKMIIKWVQNGLILIYNQIVDYVLQRFFLYLLNLIEFLLLQCYCNDVFELNTNIIIGECIRT